MVVNTHTHTHTHIHTHTQTLTKSLPTLSLKRPSGLLTFGPDRSLCSWPDFTRDPPVCWIAGAPQAQLTPMLITHGPLGQVTDIRGQPQGPESWPEEQYTHKPEQRGREKERKRAIDRERGWGRRERGRERMRERERERR